MASTFMKKVIALWKSSDKDVKQLESKTSSELPPPPPPAPMTTVPCDCGAAVKTSVLTFRYASFEMDGKTRVEGVYTCGRCSAECIVDADGHRVKPTGKVSFVDQTPEEMQQTVLASMMDPFY